MAKKESVETQDVNEIEKEEVTIASNIVKLENGEIVDFGKSGTIFASYDVETRTLTFKVVTGEVITYTLSEEEQAGLTNNQIEHILYARQEKIKSTLPPVKTVLTEEEARAGKLNKAAKIRKELADLAAGMFVTRQATHSVSGLDSFMKAFAYINATGTVKVNDMGGLFAVPETSLTVEELKPHWGNINDLVVISEVTAFWNSLDRSTKANQRRNTFITTQAKLIEDGAVTI